MKKFVWLITIGIIPIWIAFYFFADKGVKMDVNLESALMEELQTKKLTKIQIKSVESLDLSFRNLTSIEGLQYFEGLKELNLSGNVIVDGSPLHNLESLVTLDLSFNQLDSLQLNSLNIEMLNLEANRLSSLDFILPLKNITYLNVRENNIADISPLENLNQLHALNIRGNQVKNLDVLEGKKTLMDLNARNNQITSVLPIQDLLLYERVYLSGNKIIDLELLEPKLKMIDDYDFEIPITVPISKTPSGVYKEPFELELRTAKHHQIYYTLDGSIPNLRSAMFTGPIEITPELMLEQPMYSNIQTSPMKDAFSFTPEDVKKAITVTAASYYLGTFSKPVSFTYILDPDTFESELPVISLTINPKDLFDDDGGIYVPGNLFEEGYLRTGNYYQKGRAYEKEASFEYFNEDGTLGFKQPVGVRINGSSTRRLPQKSLRIYPRSEYGQSRIYAKLFEELPYYEFNLLVLRSGGNDDESTLLRDGLMHELVKNRDVDVQAYKPSILLINGEYWGIHNIREKFNSDYIDVKYNVKEPDLTMMSFTPGHETKFSIDVGTEKDQVHYDDLIAFVEDNDLADDEKIQHVDTLMDIDNFLEYVAYQVYYANTDSFYNNLTVWRKNVEFMPNAPFGHDGRWRWMLYDLDWGMGYGLLEQEGDPVDFNMMDFVTRDHVSVLLFKQLMKNEKLQLQFTETMIDLLQTNFETETVNEKIDELAEVIRPEIPQSIARWKNIESIEAWEQNIQALHEFAERRPEILRNHLRSTFNLTADELMEIEERVKERNK